LRDAFLNYIYNRENFSCPMYCWVRIRVQSHIFYDKKKTFFPSGCFAESGFGSSLRLFMTKTAKNLIGKFFFFPKSYNSKSMRSLNSIAKTFLGLRNMNYSIFLPWAPLSLLG
jgi:hypothetical protein